MPDFDYLCVARAMAEMERDMEHLDENNPRHMAHDAQNEGVVAFRRCSKRA